MNVISENAREGLMNKIWYANDLVLMNESTENLKEQFFKWKEAFGRKGLKVMRSLKNEVLKSKVDPCAKCSKRVMANSMICTKRGKWLHDKCAKMKRITSTLS